MKPLYDLEELMASRLRTGILHPLFGDLNRKGAVRIEADETLKETYEERPFAFVHLSVTGRCNARCKGCINGLSLSDGTDLSARGEEVLDTLPERDAKAILRLLAGTEEKEVVICLYGGEPLLVMDKIEQLYGILSTGNVPFDLSFMVYTNGQLLSKAIEKHAELLSRIRLFSVSIDGRTVQHNMIRVGTDLAKIRTNLGLLKEIRTGSVLMWSTVREGQSLIDCFEEFLELNGEGLADHFFWHWVETKKPFESFPLFIARYEADLRKIMEAYADALSKGRILSIIHINELILYILTGRKRRTTGCGVEIDGNYDIVGGKIYACADLPLSDPIGHIGDDGTPHLSSHDLSRFTAYKDDLGCYGCGVHNYCGGRCPVQALMSEAARLVQYCQLMRLHVGVVIEYMPRIKAALHHCGVTLQEIYDRSAVITQFTDVTP